MNGYFDGPDEVVFTGTPLLTDLRGALCEVAALGVSIVRGAVPSNHLTQLAREASGQLLVPADDVQNGVVQNFDEWAGDFPTPSSEALNALGNELTGQVPSSGIGLLAPWRPNQTSVHHYNPNELGIGAHRDSKRFGLLVAVFNLTGEAIFETLAPDRVTVERTQPCAPGDLILLSGTGLGALVDRPVHRISHVTKARISLAYRMVES